MSNAGPSASSRHHGRTQQHGRADADSVASDGRNRGLADAQRGQHALPALVAVRSRVRLGLFAVPVARRAEVAAREVRARTERVAFVRRTSEDCALDLCAWKRTHRRPSRCRRDPAPGRSSAESWPSRSCCPRQLELMRAHGQGIARVRSIQRDDCDGSVLLDPEAGQVELAPGLGRRHRERRWRAKCGETIRSPSARGRRPCVVDRLTVDAGLRRRGRGRSRPT